MKNLLARIVRWVAHRYAPPEFFVLIRRQKAMKSAAFPHKNIHVASDVEKGNALILAPHPDDEVIGPGGVLSKHLKNGDAVTTLYLTNGRGVGSNSENLIATRKKEAMNLAAEFGFKQIFWLEEDTQLRANERTVQALIAILESQKPSTIYLPSFFDHHFDHFATNQILVEALSQYKDDSIMVWGYEVWDNMPFPNAIVDISGHFENKARMLKHYKTPLLSTDFIELCNQRNALHYTLYINSGIRAEKGHAEAFCRLDAKTYCATFYEVLQGLQNNKSILPVNIKPGA